jgi:hypothetical protein
MPLLLVGQLPFFTLVKPRITVGPTFVIQRSTDYTVDATVDTLIRAPEPASYVMLTTGIGLAFAVGNVRIPVDLRLNYQWVDDRPETRGRYVYTNDESGLFLDEISVNAAWQAQLWFLVGVQYSDEIRPW